MYSNRTRRNKAIYITVIGMLVVILMWQTSYVRHRIYVHVHDSVSYIAGLEIKLQSDWYEVLNTENDVFTRMVGTVFGSETAYPTAGFERAGCQKDDVCTIDIDIPDRGTSYSLTDAEAVALPWGKLYSLGEWTGEGGTVYYTFYSTDYNLRITVTDPAYLRAVLGVQRAG